MFSLQAKTLNGCLHREMKLEDCPNCSPIQRVRSQRASTLCNAVLCRDLTVHHGWGSSRLGGDGNAAGRNERSQQNGRLGVTLAWMDLSFTTWFSLFLSRKETFHSKKNFSQTPSERISQEKQQVKFCSEWRKLFPSVHFRHRSCFPSFIRMHTSCCSRSALPLKFKCWSPGADTNHQVKATDKQLFQYGSCTYFPLSTPHLNLKLTPHVPPPAWAPHRPTASICSILNNTPQASSWPQTFDSSPLQAMGSQRYIYLPGCQAPGSSGGWQPLAQRRQSAEADSLQQPAAIAMTTSKLITQLQRSF